MNITELRYLVAIMKWGSVSAAAKQLYAAQPNVSKALKNLEEEYHLRIFERSSTGMIPTEQGRHFIEQAARILEEVDRLDQGVQEEQKRCTTASAGMSMTAAGCMCMSGAASSRSCSGFLRPICGLRPCPGGHWTSSIWCSKSARPSTRRCGM